MTEIIDHETGEVTERPEATNVPAAIIPTGDFLAALSAMGYEVAEQITRTVLKQIEMVPFGVTFESAAYESKIEPQPGQKRMNKARVADVVNIATGEKQTLIMNTVLEGELEKAFPTTAKIKTEDGKEIDNPDPIGYVGKTFLVRPKAQTGKDYKVYEIIRLAKSVSTAGASVVADGENPVNRAGKVKS